MNQSIMKGAEPFVEINGPRGVLFIHGFTGSPHEHRMFARRLADLGYSVSVPLLAGHGTKPEHLAKVTWQDWHRSAIQALFDLKKSCPATAVVGLSMGGTLALHLAAHYDLRGVAALAPALYLSDWRLKLLPVMKHIIPSLKKSKGVDIKDPSAKIHAVHYEDRPLSSVAELLKLLEHVKHDLIDVHTPTLLVFSKQDHVVPYGNLALIQRLLSARDIRTLELKESYHGLTLDIERETVFQAVQQFIEDVLPLKE